MQQSFDGKILGKVNFLFPKYNNINELVSGRSFSIFNQLICDFLDEVSKMVMKDTESKKYPDVITFAFFCRKANIEQQKKIYSELLENRLGRGITFHVAPSNVPINFAYTLIAGLLSGNRCIVRSSTKDFQQTRILCRIFDEVSGQDKFIKIREIFSVVMYEHDEEITSLFSSICNLRIIWGGDNTIADIRKSPLPARSTEVTFADRYSFAVFNANYIVEQQSLNHIAHDFYNDTYLYDQNACSSPRLIVWYGNDDDCDKAKEKFWNAVHAHLEKKYELAPVLAVDKLAAQFKCSIELKNTKIENLKDNLISRVNLSELPLNINDYSCAGGLYLEYSTQNLDNLIPIITEKFQTLSYLGMDTSVLRKFVIENGLHGIDRIVPVGKTADFSFIWDGYDLIEAMSREIYVQKR